MSICRLRFGNLCSVGATECKTPQSASCGRFRQTCDRNAFRVRLQRPLHVLDDFTVVTAFDAHAMQLYRTVLGLVIS